MRWILLIHRAVKCPRPETSFADKEGFGVDKLNLEITIRKVDMKLVLVSFCCLGEFFMYHCAGWAV